MNVCYNKSIGIILCTLSLCWATAGLAQPTLLASWTFNNTSADVTGNGFDAAFRGNIEYSEDAAKGSHSIALSGTPDYAYIGPFDFGDQFTICAWVYLEFDLFNIQTIIGNAMGGSTVDGFKLFVNNWDTANHRILIESADGTARLDAMTAEGVFEPGYWNHVAATLDRNAGLAKIYYNGKDVTQNGAIVTGFQTTEPVAIGAMPGPSWHWTGLIDDVRIYEGLLTADEINDVMTSPETSVRHAEDAGLVTSYRLSNYPNPFNASTTLSYTLPQAQHVRLTIVTIDGQTLQTLVDEKKSSGTHTISWNSRNTAGRELPSGVYLASLRTETELVTQKLLLVK